MKLITLEEALQRLEGVKVPLRIEDVSILKSIGRFLAEDVVSDIELPPFDKSSRDGYAVRAKDTFTASESNPVKLRLKGYVKIGEIPRFRILDNECAYIPTGAPLPEGSDAVVMVENTYREGGTVYIYKAVPPSENVVRRGSDIPKHLLVLRRGTRIGVGEIALLAAIGRGNVKVYERPKAMIISTGPELVEVGKSLVEGKIYDINNYMIYSYLIGQLGLEPEILGILDDAVETLKKAVIESLKNSDLIFISGGTSKGEGDLLHNTLIEILKERMGKILFHGISLKPGKPTIIAVIEGKPVIGLPGNPTSAFTVLEVLIKPWILKCIFGAEQRELTINAVLTRKLLNLEGRREIVYVKLINVGDKVLAQPILKGSEATTTFVEADGYIEIPEDVNFVEEGSTVKVKLIDV
ncbi:MAG: molybdopterin-binding protein [Candidatus Nezhaarchaeales archaeon]